MIALLFQPQKTGHPNCRWTEGEKMKSIFEKTSVAIAMMLMLCVVDGCAYNMRPIDVSQVQSGVVKGKTTMTEIETTYGKPYNKGIMKDGTAYYYYLSVNPITGGSQDFTFYFDKDGKVANYATEYPGGNPLLK